MGRHNIQPRFPEDWEDPESMLTDARLTGARSELRTARDFLMGMGLKPTPDAVGQLTEVFVPCLRIMCDPDHPWDPNGATWRKAGIFGALADARKKWERFWERTWTHGKRHDDSGYDLINYVGFVMRADPESRWSEWGEPG